MKKIKMGFLVAIISAIFVLSGCDLFGSDDDNAVTGEFQNSEELAYDDGSPEEVNSPWTEASGSQIAVCFTPPAYPTRIDTARFFVTEHGTPTTSFGAVVYAADDQGRPGTLLLQDEVNAAASEPNSWVSVDLRAHSVTVEQGSFCVAMKWTTASGTDGGSKAQFLGVDKTNPAGRTYWLWSGDDSWVPTADVGVGGDRNAMIRAVVAY